MRFVPFILMIIGGICIVIAVVGIMFFVLEPLYRSFQIVIRRKDDYSHYNTPSGLALLEKEKRNYWTYIIALLVIGSVLFYCGYYMFNASRGDKDNSGTYTSDDGVFYNVCFEIRGTEIRYRNKPVSYEEAEAILNEESKADKTKVFIKDDYADFSTCNEFANRVKEKGYYCVVGEN